MKAVKLIWALGIGLIAFWACEKEPEATAPEIELQPTPEEELMGTWDARFIEAKTIMTTNIDQTILDQNSEGEGAIEVTGAVTATLTYMVGVWRDQYGTSVSVSNQPSSTREYPVYFLYCWGDDWGAYCYLSIAWRYGYRSYFGEGDFSLDLETYTLHLDGVVLSSWDEDETVIVTGTLTGPMLDLPANTPTVVRQFTDDDPDNSLKFKENDIFLWVFGDEYFNSGFWKLEDDTLTLYVEGEYLREILHFTYDLSADSLTLELEENACSWVEEDSVQYAWCLEDYERSYGLDEGSLASIVFHLIQKYSRSGDEFARELEAIEGLERRSIRSLLHELEKKERGQILNIR